MRAGGVFTVFTAILLWILSPVNATTDAIVSCGMDDPYFKPIPGHVAEDVLNQFFNRIHNLNDYVEVYNDSKTSKARIALGPGGVFGGLTTFPLHAKHTAESYQPYGWLTMAASSSSTQNTSSRAETVFTKEPLLKFPDKLLRMIIGVCGGREAEDVSGHVEMPDGSRYEIYGEPWLLSDGKKYPFIPGVPWAPLRGPARTELDGPWFQKCYTAGVPAIRNISAYPIAAFCRASAGKLLMPGTEEKVQMRMHDDMYSTYIKTAIQVHWGGREWRIQEDYCNYALKYISYNCHQYGKEDGNGGAFRRSNVMFILDINRHKDKSYPTVDSFNLWDIDDRLKPFDSAA